MQEKTLQNPKIRTSNIHSMDFGSVSYDILVHHTGNIDVVGWQDTTTTSETQRFNNWGLFDRQSRNLKSYCKEIVKEKEL